MQNNNWLSGEVNYRGHHLEGVSWPVTGKSGSKNTVTMAKNGLVCSCTMFKFWSRCPHCVTVEKKLLGE